MVPCRSGEQAAKKRYNIQKFHREKRVLVDLVLR